MEFGNNNVGLDQVSQLSMYWAEAAYEYKVSACCLIQHVSWRCLSSHIPKEGESLCLVQIQFCSLNLECGISAGSS